MAFLGGKNGIYLKKQKVGFVTSHLGKELNRRSPAVGRKELCHCCSPGERGRRAGRASRALCEEHWEPLALLPAAFALKLGAALQEQRRVAAKVRGRAGSPEPPAARAGAQGSTPQPQPGHSSPASPEPLQPKLPPGHPLAPAGLAQPGQLEPPCLSSGPEMLNSFRARPFSSERCGYHFLITKMNRFYKDEQL